jgi:hypothetical protein
MISKLFDSVVSSPAPRGYTGRHRAALTPSTTSKPNRNQPKPSGSADVTN